MNSAPWWAGNALVFVFGMALLLIGAADHFWSLKPWSESTQLDLIWGGVVVATGSAAHAVGKASPTP